MIIICIFVIIISIVQQLRTGKTDMKYHLLLAVLAAHYNLTKNYVLHTETATRDGNSDVVKITESTQPLRWFFSFTAGLSYKF